MYYTKELGLTTISQSMVAVVVYPNREKRAVKLTNHEMTFLWHFSPLAILAVRQFEFAVGGTVSLTFSVNLASGVSYNRQLLEHVIVCLGISDFVSHNEQPGSFVAVWNECNWLYYDVTMILQSTHFFIDFLWYKVNDYKLSSVVWNAKNRIKRSASKNLKHNTL